ncbi:MULTISPECIES: nuclease-related domain-containing protein [unclassified Nocardioides]|uniref:nuclease-related domain-containing protein n=1 Tax=unclassified Nocardioides TaxID=2615069 RepID=UPI0009F15EAE|nr:MULTISPECIES: nuclease-related domain-containing protein [unclassified Nocardioides]GAW49073.1 uncharacterized protein PD653B2_1393 [Nocardioides sp. PD653-B2]GAW53229.1 uncharacterized protein PD653_0627 [Nocardioides sp. PD653]
MDGAAVEIRRWRRYGGDRLYVALSDGTSLGWWDLRANQAHPATGADHDALAAAVRDWKATAGLPSSQDAPKSGRAGETWLSTEAVAAGPWFDLTTNNPGEAARAQALAAKQAAPGRALLARALRVHTSERAWRIGADGEEKVAAQFDKVVRKDPRWQFIHAIPVGTRGSDIDHLVVGPGGVFTVNAKNHPHAKVWVGGEGQDAAAGCPCRAAAADCGVAAAPRRRVGRRASGGDLRGGSTVDDLEVAGGGGFEARA